MPQYKNIAQKMDKFALSKEFHVCCFRWKAPFQNTPHLFLRIVFNPPYPHPHCVKLTHFVTNKDEFIVSRIYRMLIYRTFLYIEEYIVSNLPYWVSRYSQNQWFFCLFSSKILRKFRKFPENSENPWTKVLNNNNNAENSKNLPKIPKNLKICWKFGENS